MVLKVNQECDGIHCSALNVVLIDLIWNMLMKMLRKRYTHFLVHSTSWKLYCCAVCSKAKLVDQLPIVRARVDIYRLSVIWVARQIITQIQISKQRSSVANCEGQGGHQLLLCCQLFNQREAAPIFCFDSNKLYLKVNFTPFLYSYELGLKLNSKLNHLVYSDRMNLKLNFKLFVFNHINLICTKRFFA